MELSESRPGQAVFLQEIEKTSTMSKKCDCVSLCCTSQSKLVRQQRERLDDVDTEYARCSYLGPNGRSRWSGSGRKGGEWASGGASSSSASHGGSRTLRECLNRPCAVSQSAKKGQMCRTRQQSDGVKLRDQMAETGC